MSAPAPLGVVAHYTLLERLEPAGPGDLYRARDTHRGRTVAVRLLPRGFTADPATLVQNARSLISLSHPNVITLFDVGEHDGRVFLVFEFLKGQSLRAEMAGRPLNVRRALDLAVQMTDAVADAHAAGFVHGGLSPDSVVVTAKGHAKIPAFELAAHGGFEQADGEVRLRDYDSPEEARGERPDERSDIYSVGAILYEMLTTRRPHHRGAAAPSASNPHVPKELDDVVLKAVAPNRDSRYQSAAALAGELRGVASVIDVRGGAGDEEDEHPEPPASASRVVAIAVALLLALAAIAWWFMRS
jgi:serine/threonine protein kinase